MCKKSNNEVCAHLECAAPQNETTGNKSPSVTGLCAIKAFAKNHIDIINSLDAEKDYFNIDEVRGKWNAYVSILHEIEIIEQEGA